MLSMITSFRTYTRVTDIAQDSENEVEKSKIAFWAKTYIYVFLTKNTVVSSLPHFGGSSGVNIMGACPRHLQLARQESLD